MPAMPDLRKLEFGLKIFAWLYLGRATLQNRLFETREYTNGKRSFSDS